MVHQRRNRAGIAGILWAGRQFAASIAASGQKIGQAAIDLAGKFVRTRFRRRDPGCELSLPICFLISVRKRQPARLTPRACYRAFVGKLRSLIPFSDVGLFSAATKLNAEIERFAEKLPKKSIALSERDRARIAQFFPYTVGEDD